MDFIEQNKLFVEISPKTKIERKTTGGSDYEQEDR